VPPQGVSAHALLHVPDFDALVHAARGQELAGLVELGVPDHLDVVLKRVHALTVLAEVPDFGGPVGRGGGEQISPWMEVDARQPVRVPLAAHQLLAFRDVPQLPCAVVTRSSQDGFLRVHGHLRDAQRVGFEGFGETYTVSHDEFFNFSVGLWIFALFWEFSVDFFLFGCFLDF